MRSIICIAALAGLGALLAAGDCRAQSWGDLKGQVVWTGGAIPAKENITPNKDVQHCLSKGPLISDALVIDPTSKGVKNVMVWLAPAEAGGKIPIHPSLAAVPKEKVVIDQPCCMFTPRITMMREGQTLEIKNSAPVLHNSKVIGSPTVNGTFNLSIPANTSIEKHPKAEKKPMLLNCDIHGWMGGRIGVFNHPYFAVTKDDGTFEIKNAPAGKFKIYLQHEKAGWLHHGGTSAGQEITIKPGSNDLGKFEMSKAE